MSAVGAQGILREGAILPHGIVTAMRSKLMAAAVVALLAGAGAPLGAAEPDAARPAPKAAPAAKLAAIVMHEGVPGAGFLGQPLASFIAAFPSAKSSPFAGQPDVVRLQVAKEGISALAMGLTPASMTIESIGFNFAGVYEGVEATRRRTVEGIGTGSTVNELLEAYGKPAEAAPEGRRGALTPQSAAPDRNAPMRYLYRNSDATIATYFVVEGAQVSRMAMSRPASVERWILKRAEPGPGAPGKAPAPQHPGAAPKSDANPKPGAPPAAGSSPDPAAPPDRAPDSAPLAPPRRDSF